MRLSFTDGGYEAVIDETSETPELLVSIGTDYGSDYARLNDADLVALMDSLIEIGSRMEELIATRRVYKD